MKWFSISIVLSIFLVSFLLISKVTLAQDDIPVITLPAINFLEVREDLIRSEGNAYPGGWSTYYVDYKCGIGHDLTGRRAEPFDEALTVPVTLEMWLVKVLLLQDHNFESDEWVEKENGGLKKTSALCIKTA